MSGGGAARGLRIVSQCNAKRSGPVVVVHDPDAVGARGAQTASKMEGTPAELHKAGVKALQSKDYRTAIDLLKRAVDADAGTEFESERRLV